MTAADHTAMPHASRVFDSSIAALFFASGFAALMYQVCWQRQLAYAFGVDLESSTIVISCFMLGMGIGALIGGQLADRSFHQLRWFCVCEVLIGAFGLASPYLIQLTSEVLQNAPRFNLAIMEFILLLTPTALMGATLPLLVIALRKRRRSIGEATGTLYCFNTLGAAAGAFATGLYLFNHLDLNQTIQLAAGINLCVAGFAAFAFRLDLRRPS